MEPGYGAASLPAADEIGAGAGGMGSVPAASMETPAPEAAPLLTQGAMPGCAEREGSVRGGAGAVPMRISRPPSVEPPGEAPGRIEREPEDIDMALAREVRGGSAGAVPPRERGEPP